MNWRARDHHSDFLQLEAEVRRPRKKRGTAAASQHLPGHHACLDCRSRLRKLGEDIAEMVERVQACFDGLAAERMV
jgi:hypothetical protein